MQGLLDGIFGGGSAPTYEAMQRRRELIELLQQQALSQPQNMGDGIAMIAKALMARTMDKRLGKQEEAERSRLVEELAGIRGSLGPEGITEDALTALGGLTANPYLPPEQEAIARSLMRRKLIPGEMAQAMPAMAQSPEGPQSGGAFGWTDPGEIPPPQATPFVPNAAPMPPMGGQQAPAVPPVAPPTAPAAPPAPPPGAPPMQPPADPMMAPGAPAQPPAPEGLAAVLSAINPFGAAAAAEPPAPPPTPPVEAPAPEQAPPVIDSKRGELKLTEGQSKDLGFWNRMSGISSDLDRMEDVLAQPGQRARGAVPFFGNALVSDEYQEARRAAEEWITGIIRKDTGAAVTAEEMEIYQKQYIPQAWDDEETIKAKREARKRAEQGLKMGLGTAEVLANEIEAVRPQPDPATPGRPKRRVEIDGYTIEEVE